VSVVVSVERSPDKAKRYPGLFLEHPPSRAKRPDAIEKRRRLVLTRE
jgi:hypothetical protein